MTNFVIEKWKNICDKRENEIFPFFGWKFFLDFSSYILHEEKRRVWKKNIKKILCKFWINFHEVLLRKNWIKFEYVKWISLFWFYWKMKGKVFATIHEFFTGKGWKNVEKLYSWEKWKWKANEKLVKTQL